MDNKEQILRQIKETVHAVAPNAKVILYGSYARGDYRPDSDIDLLILIDKDSDNVNYIDERKITYPLFDLEIEIGIIISPMVYTNRGWANHRITPYYENVNNEGVLI